ncbi:hypothetical protein [Burkholderia territorii]|uniref:hypothetical protein n=1 Tax=Burkholderia territorii TaxID=1503055 RepID=UPI0018C77CB9|nr:hypothetical protein [Burkholderia territorii]
MEAAQLRGDQEGLAQGVRARPFRISMYLASIAGGHPSLSKFDHTRYGATMCHGADGAASDGEDQLSAELTLLNETRVPAMGGGFNRSMQQLDEISLSIKHRCARVGATSPYDASVRFSDADHHRRHAGTGSS